MKQVIENFTTSSGWTESDNTKFKIHSLNQHPEFIANELSTSLLVYSSSGSGETVIKTFTAIDVTNYDELVLSVSSIRLGNKGLYFNDKDDFAYKIRFNAMMDYYMLPTFATLESVTFDISSITSIDRIDIMCNHSDIDYLILSYCIVVKDQLPIDIFTSLKTKLESRRDSVLGEGYSLELLTLSSGDNEIYFSADLDYIDKYSCIKITNGVNKEIHQLYKNDEQFYKMTSMYDGKTILNNFTNASSYIFPQVEYGQQREIPLPCIFIANNMPGQTKSAKVELDYDSYDDNRNVKYRYKPQQLKWSITIDCVSRFSSIIADLSEIVRKVIENEVLWINGKKFDIYFGTDPIFQDFDEYTNIFPKATYNIELETLEYYMSRRTLVNTDTINTTINIEE